MTSNPNAMLTPSYEAWADEIMAGLVRAGRSDEFILRRASEELEESLTERLGRHVVVCGNGTAALQLLLRAYGIGPGDEVLTPAFSFVSTTSAILAVGARPIFVDIAKHAAVIHPELLRGAVTAHTRAVIAVHLFGHAAPMQRLRSFADDSGLILIEDAAVALGGVVDGAPAGTWGHSGFYSFFPAKPAGGPGDGGAIVSGDPAIIEAVRSLRAHGQRERFVHVRLGINSRMDECMAHVIGVRLRTLDARRTRRQQAYARYQDRLVGLKARLPPPPSACAACYRYVVAVDDRDTLVGKLREGGIPVEVTNVLALPDQPAFAHLDPAGDWPHARRFAESAVSLPLFDDLSIEAVDLICDAVIDAVGRVS